MNNDSLNIEKINIVDQKNTDIRKDILIKKNVSKTIYINIFANKCVKKININLIHENKSSSNIIVNSFAKNNGHIDINITNTVKKNILGCVIKQEINGIIFDNNSTIVAKPILNLNNSQIKASHIVNIGYLNKEVVYYLNSRKLKNNEITKLMFRF